MHNQKCRKDESFEGDMQLNRGFLEDWKNGNFSERHPVYGLVRNQSVLICRRFNRQDYVEDLIQSCLMLLCRGQYKGGCPYGAYINRIVKNEMLSLLRKAGDGRVKELEEMCMEPETPPEVDKICRQMQSEKFMRNLMVSRPEIQREIIRAIVEYDGQKKLSRNQIIKKLEEKKYTRYQVIAAYRKLKQHLRQSRL